MEGALAYMGVLAASNEGKGRVRQEVFEWGSLREYVSYEQAFKVYYKSGHFLNVTRFPFLLDLDFKYRLLQIESAVEQKISVDKSLSSGLRNLMAGELQLDANGNLNIEGLVFLHFEINRQNILDDSLEKLGRVKRNLKSPMKIKFIGEEGADEGGVLNEYFQLVTKQIFNPYLDMFLHKNAGRIYWFNGFSFEAPILFEFVGMLFGLAIYNQVYLDVRFPRILYKRLLFGLAD